MSGDGSSSYARWAGGNALIPILLSQHYPSLKYRNDRKSGTLTVKIRFNVALAEAVNLYSFAISSKSLSIGRNRSVHFDDYS